MKELITRFFLFSLFSYFLLHSVGCAKKSIDVHGDRTTWVRVHTPFSGQNFQLQSFEGLVDVICLDDCPTLYSCLSRARDTIPGSVVLPKDCPTLYLGHVAEFMAQALFYYRIKDSFDTLHGYRLILRFRAIDPGQAREDIYQDCAVFSVGTAARTGALVVSGAPMMVTAPVLFLVDGTMAEFKRRQFADFARRHGLPEPDKPTWEILAEGYSRQWDILAEGMGVEDSFEPECAVVLTECRIERPTSQEISSWKQLLEQGK